MSGAVNRLLADLTQSGIVPAVLPQVNAFSLPI
jgi:hypothetical protein